MTQLRGAAAERLQEDRFNSAEQAERPTISISLCFVLLLYHAVSPSLLQACMQERLVVSHSSTRTPEP